MPIWVGKVESPTWTGGATQTTAALNVEPGDLLICFAATSSESTQIGGPPTNSGAPLTWTLLQSFTTAGYTSVHAWAATADDARALTVTLNRSGGSSNWGMTVHQWRGALLGNSVQGSAASAAPSLPITTTAATSGISYFSGDWAAKTGTATFLTINSAAGTVDLSAGGGSKFYAAHWLNVGAAGSKTTGMTAPTAQKWAGIAVEIKDNPLTRVTVTRQIVFDTLARATTTRQIVFDTLARVSTTRQILFNTLGLTRVTITREIRFNTIGRVSVTRQIRFDTLARVSTTRQIRFDTLRRASLTRQIRFDTLARVSTTREMLWLVEAPPAPPVPEALRAWPTGARTERFSYRLFDLGFKPLGSLDGVSGCTLDGSVWTPIRWGGSLEWAGTDPVDWGQVMIQPVYHVRDVGEWPLGMFLARSPRIEHDSTVDLKVSVQLYDLTYKLAQWAKLPAPLSLPAGTVVTTAIAAQLQLGGITRFSVTPSTAVLKAPMAWDSGESRLKVINDLAASISYWSAHADPNGITLVDPYAAPLERSPAWGFAPGDASIYVPRWAEEQDDFDVPNRLSGVQKVTDGVSPATYTAVLDSLDPASPYTVARRGFFVDGDTLRDVDAADAAALKAAVDRALLDAASKVRNLTVTHLWLPGVEIGDAVTFTPDGRVRRASVSKQALKLEAPLLVRSEWREVG